MNFCVIIVTELWTFVPLLSLSNFNMRSCRFAVTRSDNLEQTIQEERCGVGRAGSSDELQDRQYERTTGSTNPDSSEFVPIVFRSPGGVTQAQYKFAYKVACDAAAMV